jgi:hypothetical protein
MVRPSLLRSDCGFLGADFGLLTLPPTVGSEYSENRLGRFHPKYLIRNHGLRITRILGLHCYIGRTVTLSRALS